jgi:hypothetical protein
MQHDIKPPPQVNHTHDYSTSGQTHYKPSLNPSVNRYSPPDSPRHLPSFHNGTGSSNDAAMSGSSGPGHPYSQHHQSGSQYHRGLPPPTAGSFSLPPPTPTSTEPHYRSSSVAPPPPPPPSLPATQQQSSAITSLGQLPAPPPSWSSAASNNDESMRSWLHAKAEEDRRKQEELRLEQRHVEREMLRESLEKGIPPAMVPLIFAGMGSNATSGGLNQALEYAQSFLQTLNLQQQQQMLGTAEQQQRLAYEQQLRHGHQLPTSASSPDLRREREREQQAVRDRMIPPNPYGAQQTHGQTSAPPLSSHRSSFSSVAAQPTPGALSKLNTVDFAPTSATRQQIHPSLSAGNLSSFARDNRDEPPTGSTSGSRSGQGSGADLFFHHWTPPTGQGASGQPPTPSGKSTQGSPYGSTGSGTHGHLRKQGVEYENSPKKRKTAHTGTAGGSTGSAGSTGHAERERMARLDERAESESTGSGRDDRERDPERSREPLRPSSRQQRQEEMMAQAPLGSSSHPLPSAASHSQPHQQQSHPQSRFDEHRPPDRS